MALNILNNKNNKRMYPAYVSKYNTERKKQITLLMVEKMLLSCRNKDIYII